MLIRARRLSPFRPCAFGVFIGRVFGSALNSWEPALKLPKQE